MRPPDTDKRDSLAATVIRLLIPIDGRGRSEWSLRYATRRHGGTRRVRAELLFVAPPPRLELLRFRTEQQVAHMQRERAEGTLRLAEMPLAEAGIAVGRHFRQGEEVFHILDAAEELGCDEIVVPAPRKGFVAHLLFPEPGPALVRRQRRIPVRTVNSEGRPEEGALEEIGRGAVSYSIE